MIAFTERVGLKGVADWLKKEERQKISSEYSTPTSNDLIMGKNIVNSTLASLAIENNPTRQHVDKLLEVFKQDNGYKQSKMELAYLGILASGNELSNISDRQSRETNFLPMPNTEDGEKYYPLRNANHTLVNYFLGYL